MIILDESLEGRLVVTLWDSKELNQCIQILYDFREGENDISYKFVWEKETFILKTNLKGHFKNCYIYSKNMGVDAFKNG